MAPETISFFEHQPRSFSEIGLYPADPARRERVLAKLEQLNEITGQEILHLGRKGLRANSLVGVLQVGEITFEILPKIDWAPAEKPGESGSANQQPIHSAARNLLTMLSYAYDLRIYEQDIAGFKVQNSSWIELLTRLFAAGLHREILSGLSQQYVAQEDSLPALRGRWNVQRQLQQPDPGRQAFDVIYDELSSDIPLNQVFRFAIEQLFPITRDPDNQALLRDLREWFRPVTLLAQAPPDFLDRIHFNRMNERFQLSFNLARMFLTGSAAQVSAGEQPGYAFVFDMNTLFERFVAGFLTRYRREILPAEWQDITLRAQGEGALVYLARSDGKNLLRLRPDLLFTRAGQQRNEVLPPLLFADTKYKQMEVSPQKLGVAQEDIYQMLAYSVRLKCPHGLILYPQALHSKPVRKQIEIESAGLRLFIATLNLHVSFQEPDLLIRELHDIFQSVK